MRALLLLSLLFLSSISFAESGYFLSTCPVLSAPSDQGQMLCEKKQGTGFKSAQKKGEGFYYVETSDCAGYARVSCIGLTKNEGVSADFPTTKWRMGPRFGFSGLLGSAGGAATGGQSYLFSGHITRMFTPRFRFSFLPSFQILSLSRTLDLSGQITDTEITVSQRVHFLGGALSLAWNAASFNSVGMQFGKPNNSLLWFEIALEGLYPIYAIQTDSSASSNTFTSQERLLFLSIGPSLQSVLDSGWVIMLGVEYAYNLGSRSGSSLSSIRGTVALDFNL